MSFVVRACRSSRRCRWSVRKEGWGKLSGENTNTAERLGPERKEHELHLDARILTASDRRLACAGRAQSAPRRGRRAESAAPRAPRRERRAAHPLADRSRHGHASPRRVPATRPRDTVRGHGHASPRRGVSSRGCVTRAQVACWVGARLGHASPRRVPATRSRIPWRTGRASRNGSAVSSWPMHNRRILNGTHPILRSAETRKNNTRGTVCPKGLRHVPHDEAWGGCRGTFP